MALRGASPAPLTKGAPGEPAQAVFSVGEFQLRLRPHLINASQPA